MSTLRAFAYSLKAALSAIHTSRSCAHSRIPRVGVWGSARAQIDQAEGALREPLVCPAFPSVPAVTRESEIDSPQRENLHGGMRVWTGI
jgi:hypothetical protein